MVNLPVRLIHPDSSWNISNVPIDQPPWLQVSRSAKRAGHPATTEVGLWINRATPVTRMLQVDWVKRVNIVIQGYALGDGCRILNQPATEGLGGCSIAYYARSSRSQRSWSCPRPWWPRSWSRRCSWRRCILFGHCQDVNYLGNGIFVLVYSVTHVINRMWSFTRSWS